MFFLFCFFFKQKTAYEMRISDWSSDVCSSDLRRGWACMAEGFPRSCAATGRKHARCCALCCLQPATRRAGGKGRRLSVLECGVVVNHGIDVSLIGHRVASHREPVLVCLWEHPVGDVISR